jgi:predicted permease
MKIPLIAGRDFTNHDTLKTGKVIIVNETMGRKLWPGRDPVGQIALVGRDEWQVIGVAANVRHGSLEREAESEMYLPIAQQNDWGSLDLVVRTRLSPTALVPSVRTAIRQVDSGLPVGDFQMLGELVDRAVSPRRFVLRILGAFALAALALASLGIYGVVSYSVAQRRQEFGIRMALGASGGDVLAGVMMKTLGLTLAGIAVGLAGSLALSGIIGSLLYGVRSTDPLTFGAMALVLTIVALVAGFVPARRAARIDLASVLRAT